MLYTLTLQHHFDAAHKLPGHPGKCSRIHGHRWEVSVEITTDRLNSQNMVVDFGDVKAVIDELDHQLLNEVQPFNTVPPTAEMIASHIHHEVQRLVCTEDAVQVTVWESPNCSITVREPQYLSMEEHVSGDEDILF